MVKRDNYETPNRNNVNFGDELIANYLGNLGIFKITEVKGRYLIAKLDRGFVKSIYSDAIVKQNGNLLVGRRVSKSKLTKALEILK